MEVLAEAIRMAYASVEKRRPTKALLRLLSSAACAGLYEEFIYDWVGNPQDPTDVPEKPFVRDNGFTIRQYAGYTAEGSLIVVRRRAKPRSECTNNDYCVVSANLRECTLTRWQVMPGVHISPETEVYQLSKETVPDGSRAPVQVWSGHLFRDLLDTRDINDMYSGDRSEFACLILGNAGGNGSSVFREYGAYDETLAGGLYDLDTEYATYQRLFGALIIRPEVGLAEPGIIQG